MPQPNNLTHPLSLIRGLEKTPQYLEDLKPRGRKAALGRAASFFADKMEQKPQRTPEERLNGFSVRLLATLPDFITASRQLDILETRQNMTGNRIDRSQKIPHLEKVIPFNHTVRELIDEFPNLTVENVVGFCSVSGLELGGPKDAEYLEQQAGQVVTGMQQEIGLEQILWNIPDVEDVTQATLEQELAGMDLVVTYHGMQIGLDAKNSERGADIAHEKRDDFMRNRQLNEVDMADAGYPIWSGIVSREFHGGFRVNQNCVNRCTPYVEATLMRLADARNGATSLAQ